MGSLLGPAWVAARRLSGWTSGYLVRTVIAAAQKGDQEMGILDNTLNNADIIDQIEAINSMANSNPQDSENRNPNTTTNVADNENKEGADTRTSADAKEPIYYMHRRGR
jgi:hypothetical protein